MAVLKNHVQKEREDEADDPSGDSGFQTNEQTNNQGMFQRKTLYSRSCQEEGLPVTTSSDCPHGSPSSSKKVFTQRQLLRKSRRRKLETTASTSTETASNPNMTPGKRSEPPPKGKSGHSHRPPLTMSRNRFSSNNENAENGTKVTNGSSVATPEEHAVSTMIMALQNMSPMGQMVGRSNSVQDGTPIRSNLSWGRDEDATAGVNADATAAVNGGSVGEENHIINSASAPTTAKLKSKVTIVTPVRRAQSSDDALDVTAGVKQSRVRFEKRSTPREKELPSSSKGTAKVLSDSEAEVLTKSSSIMKSALKKVSNIRKTRDSRAPPSPRAYYDRRSRSNRYAESSYDDDNSALSDPTNDSSMDDSFRERGGEAFLDTLLDLVSFDISMDDEVHTQYTDDEDYSKDDSIVRNENVAERKSYACSRCMNNDSAEASFEDNRNMRSGCSTMEAPADIGKEVLSDISTAFSFKEEKQSSCQTMEAPAETGKRVLSDLSSALSFKDNEDSNKVTENTGDSRGYLPNISSSLGINRVFRESSSPQTTDDSDAHAPVKRVDSAQLTYVSDLTSLAAGMEHVTRSFELESQRVMDAIKSPLSFASSIGSKARTATEDYEEDLQLAQGIQGDDKKTREKFRSETGPSDISRSANNAADSTSDVGQDAHSQANIMSKAQASFAKMNRKDSGKSEEDTSDAQAKFDEVLNSFQRLITCHRSSPSSKDKQDTGETGFLTTLSKTFSFWSNDNRASSSANSSHNKESSETEESNAAAKEASVPWEKMGRSFPKTDAQDIKRSNDDCSVGSEASLSKDVTVTIHTIKISLSDDDEKADSPKKVLKPKENESPAAVHIVRYEHQNSAKEDASAPCIHKQDGTPDMKTAEFANFDELALPTPPASPEYKIPSREPESATKSLPSQDGEAIKTSVSSMTPRRMKVATLSARRKATARRMQSYKRTLSNTVTESSPSRVEDQPKTEATSVCSSPEELRDEFCSNQEEKKQEMDDEISPVKTWETADVNTSSDSWHDFKNGEVFSALWPASSPAEVREESTEEQEPFKVTYQNTSSKWLRKSQRKLEVESPKNVLLYGKDTPEFKAFGRRSLLKALSGTTQAEI